MSQYADQDCRRHASLRGVRNLHEDQWRQVFEYMAPERGHGFQGTMVSANDAAAQRARITDSTAIDAARLCTSGFASGMHPANSLWFGMDAGQESESERRWLDSAARTIFENIHNSGFDGHAIDCLADMVMAGWFVMYIDESPTGGYSFDHWPLHQCYIASSLPGGKVDTVFREFELSVEQLVSEYGIDKVSSQVAEKYRLGGANYDEMVKVLWCIYPRKMYSAGGARLAKNKPFASMHYELDTKHELRESGYDEFPCAVPRWRLIPGTAYATGLASDALPDIKTLNDIKRLEYANLDIAVSGMYKAVDDGVLNPKTVRIGPRKIIMMASLDSMAELKSAGNFDVSFTKSEQLQASIRRMFLADQLQPQDGPQMTAEEVRVRVGLIRQQNGPIFARLTPEYLQTLVERCFAIAFRAGVLGQPPESLANRDYTIKYTSPLARAQRMEEVSAIDAMLAGVMQHAQIDPNIIDLIDGEVAQREKAIALGVPSKMIRSTDDVTARRKAKAEAAAAQAKQEQQAQMMQQVVPGMVDNAMAA
jgi:Bacteriophage head to tail connecting protein